MVIQLTAARLDEQAILKDQAAKESVAEAERQFMKVLPTTDPLSIALQLALWRANHAQYLSNCRIIESLGLPVSVTGKRLAILRTLYFAPEKQMTVSALSKVVRRSPAAVTNYVDSLSRGSLVRRTSGAADRRQNLIQLTAKGEAAFKDISGLLSQSWTNACEGLTDEDKDLMVRLLRRLA